MSDPSITYLLPSDLPQTYVVKAEEPTDPKYGFEPKNRPMDYYIDCGIVNLDKPAGPTSHEVSSWVRKVLHIPHAGHGGTLNSQSDWDFAYSIGQCNKSHWCAINCGEGIYYGNVFT